MKSTANYLGSHLEGSSFINEVGMKLTSYHFSKIRRKLQSLELRAPAMSSVHLNFENMGNEIKGMLSINGFRKNFKSTVSGNDPLEIYSRLESNIDEQLLAWKKARFINQYIGTSRNDVCEQQAGDCAV